MFYQLVVLQLLFLQLPFLSATFADLFYMVYNEKCEQRSLHFYYKATEICNTRWKFRWDESWTVILTKSYVIESWPLLLWNCLCLVFYSFIYLFILFILAFYFIYLSFLFILKQFIALNDSVSQVLNLKWKSCEFTCAKNACKISQPHCYTEWKAVAYVCYIYLAFLSQNWSTIKKKAALNVMPLNK